MTKSKTHYLGKSREVLQINDPVKLQSLLNQQRSELFRLSIGYGRKRMSPLMHKKTNKDTKAINNTRKNIARILTRINQLKLKERLANS